MYFFIFNKSFELKNKLNIKTIKRPLNPFILYLIDIRKELNDTEYKLKQIDIRKIASTLWKEENINVKNQYIERSKEYKKDHYIKYPKYIKN